MEQQIVLRRDDDFETEKECPNMIQSFHSILDDVATIVAFSCFQDKHTAGRSRSRRIGIKRGNYLT